MSLCKLKCRMNSLGCKWWDNLFNSLFNKQKMTVRLLIWQKSYLIYKLSNQNIRKSLKSQNLNWG